MATRTHKARALVLDERIDILSRNALVASPAQHVYRTVGAILTLVRVSVPVLLPPRVSH